MPSFIPAMRAREQRIFQLLHSSSTRVADGQSDATLQQLQYNARELTFRAEMRLEQQDDRMRRWREQQEKDPKAAFIWSLVPAYTAEDAYGHRLPVIVAASTPTVMKEWWDSLSMASMKINPSVGR